METLYVIFGIVAIFVAFYYFTKFDSFHEEMSIDHENVENAKTFFSKLITKLRIKYFFFKVLGEIFDFIQELTSSSERAKWNVRKELVFIMLFASVFYGAHLAGYTYTPYIIFGLISVVVFVLRKTGHLKNAESESTEVQDQVENQEKTDKPNYENMDDIQVGFDMAKKYFLKIYELSVGSILGFVNKSISKEGRKTLLLEQELILCALITLPYVYYGWEAFEITIIVIVADYVIELLRGRRETYEEMHSKLKDKNAERSE